MKTILVVEDDDDMRELMASMLARAGYGVREARNGQEALDALEQPLDVPSLVLLDLMMPVMSGAEFLEALRTRSGLPSPPVVVLSAVADRLKPSGALAYLAKPDSEEALLKIVRAYCAG